MRAKWNVKERRKSNNNINSDLSEHGNVKIAKQTQLLHWNPTPTSIIFDEALSINIPLNPIASR